MVNLGRNEHKASRFDLHLLICRMNEFHRTITCSNYFYFMMRRPQNKSQPDAVRCYLTLAFGASIAVQVFNQQLESKVDIGEQKSLIEFESNIPQRQTRR